ncbi:unnamed protein product [Polarella glacialis]|uniref:Uncharacterized protein n=1 Tax=Polarella glacialis TaxID=89957 RepID=A0A813M0H1_POLGL|nr:unnamed protein product [Polarella glacialis]
MQEEVALASQVTLLWSQLSFCGFELFPPGKMNLVVARFEPSPSLLQLREAALSRCKEDGLSLPSSLFSLLEQEGAWPPHVTLGKIRATKSDVGAARCGAQMAVLAPTGALQPSGLTLLGERPPRAWCDWDGALTFRNPVVNEEL